MITDVIAGRYGWSLSDAAARADVVRQHFRSVLGREPSDSELERFVPASVGTKTWDELDAEIRALSSGAAAGTARGAGIPWGLIVLGVVLAWFLFRPRS